MKKVILNKCYGMFQVSPRGYSLYAKKIGKQIYCYRGSRDSENGHVYVKESLNEFIKDGPTFFYFYSTVNHGDKVTCSLCKNDFEGCLILDEEHRFDPILIEVIKELGDDASGTGSELRIVEIPDDVAEDYMIDNYDGFEKLHKRVIEY